MRTLKFNVNGMVVKQDPNCDFSNLVPGTEEYLVAEFSFSPEWNGYAKVAGFYSIMGTEYTPQPLTDNRCIIPAEALEKRAFKIVIVGGNGKKRLRTNKITVKQDGGKT
jgi:hypothetical protein